MTVKSTTVTVFSWVSLCLNSVVPFTILLTINCQIILTMKRHSKMLAIHDKGADGSSANATQKQNNRDRQITIMLLVVTFTLLLLTVPQYLRYVIFKFVDQFSSPARNAFYVFMYHVTNKLIFTNSAINFFLYSLAGSKFRSETANLSKCFWKPSKIIQSKRANSVHPTSFSHTC